MGQQENGQRPLWAYVDTALLVAIIGLFAKVAAWQGEVDEWRASVDMRLTQAAGQRITPGASEAVAVLNARVKAAEESQATLKVDIVARLDRQDRKLDGIAERIDKLRNGN